MTAEIDQERIREAVRAKYGDVARSADALFPYETGPAGARALGYDAGLVDAAPPEMVGSFCGVGNPFSLGEIGAGATILDLGCGAGFDVFVASRAVGPRGRALGVDLTPAMVEAAGRNLARAGAANAEVWQGTSEELPFDDATADVVLSNGVLNLSPDKRRSFAEVFRVLRPGGALRFADVVLDEDLPDEVVGSLEAWSS